MEERANNGWSESAAAWIASQGDDGDWSRRCVMDAAMLERVAARPHKRALDVGCGEGRFCRLLGARGIHTTGLDPTQTLLAEARRRDETGDYVLGVAEKLPFDDASFDLVVFYLSLIDIADFRAALAEAQRVMAAGATLLIANTTSFTSCGEGAVRDERGQFLHYPVDRYSDEFFQWAEWSGMRVQNWHRPLSAYMQTLLQLGLRLEHFDEPLPRDCADDKQARYRRAPWLLLMEWTKQAQ